MRFPGFRDRALTLSYDDGTVHDKRLAEIMKKYGVRGTFNINSGRMGKDRRLTQEEMVELYNDDHFEVAVHGYKHYPLTSINIGSAVWDIAYDRANLENIFGKIIRGMAYANGDYNDEVWYATNIEIYEYVKAFDNLVFSHDNSMVYNPSAQDVYLRFYKQNVLVKAGQTLTLPIE